MLAKADDEAARQSTEDKLATMEPLSDREQFTEIMTNLAGNFAPRLFAVVQELGERVDARIAGWGMAFENRAEVISVDGSLQMKLNTPEEALRGFAWRNYITPHLVWIDPKEEESDV